MINSFPDSWGSSLPACTYTCTDSVWLRGKSCALSLSSVRTQIMGLHVNRTLVQISISYLFPPSALPLSLLTLLSPVCCYTRLSGFFSACYYLLHWMQCLCLSPASLPSTVNSQFYLRRSNTRYLSYCRDLRGL